MANTVSISVASQLSIGPMIQVDVTILDGVTTISSTSYTFSANDFSCAYDTQQPNIAVFHFGNNHTVTISNADYSTFQFGGAPQASAIALAGAVCADIAQYSA